MNTNITTNEHQESNEETGTQVEAAVEEQDELQRRFNIVPRFIEPERKKAAHDAWIEFCSQPMEPVMFIKLLGVCEGNVAEATVLWDILCYQRKQGLKRWKQPTGCYFTAPSFSQVPRRRYTRQSS